MVNNTKVLLDPVGNTMNIWWGDPSDADHSEEVDDPNRNDIIVYDKKGKPISLEIIGVFPQELNVSDLISKFGMSQTDPFILHS